MFVRMYKINSSQHKIRYDLKSTLNNRNRNMFQHYYRKAVVVYTFLT